MAGSTKRKIRNTALVATAFDAPPCLEAKGLTDVDLIPNGEVDPDAVARILSAPVIPSTLSDRTRLQLAQLAEQGGILALPFRGHFFADKPNARHFRLQPKGFEKRAKEVAKSNPPVRLMLNHGDSAQDRVGDWTSATVEEYEGVRWMVGEGVIRKPSAQADYLRGMLDRFSVGIGRFEGVRTCSICGAEYESQGGYNWPTCDHFPGDNVEGVVCEQIIDGHVLEASFVYEGAVAGTHIGSLADDTEECAEMPQPRDQENTPAEAAAEAVSVEAAAPVDQAPERAAHAAEVAGMLAELHAAKAAQAKAEAEARELVLSSYVAERKIYPAEVEYYRKIWSDSGRAAAEAQLALRPSLVLPIAAAQPAEPEPVKTYTGVNLDACVASVERARRLGFLLNTYTAEDIKALGLDRLRWS